MTICAWLGYVLLISVSQTLLSYLTWVQERVLGIACFRETGWRGDIGAVKCVSSRCDSANCSKALKMVSLRKQEKWRLCFLSFTLGLFVCLLLLLLFYLHVAYVSFDCPCVYCNEELRHFQSFQNRVAEYCFSKCAWFSQPFVFLFLFLLVSLPSFSVCASKHAREPLLSLPQKKSTSCDPVVWVRL